MAQDSAVRFFRPEHPALARNLRLKLEKRKAELEAALSGGYAQDWPDYKDRVGVIKGINEAIAFCTETEKELGD